MRSLPQPWALFVTIPEGSAAGTQVLRDFPHANVRAVVNVGRDVGPFLTLLPELKRFDLVCKLHTKGNDERRRAWRLELLRGVLGSRRLVRAIIAAFAADERMILAGPASLWIDGPRHVMGTGAELAKRCAEIPARYGFFAGTVFWMRPLPYADFPAGNPQSDFKPHNDLDYQPEHAIERLFGVRAAQLGARIGLSQRTVWGGWRISTVAADAEVAAPDIGERLERIVAWEKLSYRRRLLLGSLQAIKSFLITP